MTSSSLTSAGDALAAIDISAVDSDDDEEEYHYAPSPSSTFSSSYRASPPPTSPTTSLSVPSSPDSFSSASPPTSTKTVHKELEPTDSSTDFWWPEEIPPEYLPGSLQPEAAQPSPSYPEIAVFSESREQVVPFMSQKFQWAPLKPSPLRIVWTMEEEEKDHPFSTAPVETEIGNGVENFEEAVGPLNRMYLSFQMLRLMSS